MESEREQKREDNVNRILRHYRATWAQEGARGLRHPVTERNQDHITVSGERLIINSHIRSIPVYAEHLLRYDWACRFVAGRQVLDAACGAGYGSKMLEMAGAADVCGIDVDEDSLRHAQQDYAGERIRFRKADIRALPFPDASFDLAVSFETIEHISDGADWIRESARVLKPGGLFLVSTPNRTASNPGLFYEEPPLNPFHFYEYSASEFVGELLPHYDLLELYGQTLAADRDDPGHRFLRQRHGRNQHWYPNPSPPSAGHELVPFSQIKNAQPQFVVALCRKKDG